jgi:type I restriction enzyme R subunit
MLAEIGFGIAPKSRKQRLEALHYKHYAWFGSLHPATANTLLALARQFEDGGTEELENPYVFSAPDVVKAGGYEALKILGEPKDIIVEMKARLFAA